MITETKISKAQQAVIDLQEKHGKLKFIAWGMNYFRVMDKNNEWVGGRVRHETYDALIRKGLLK